MGNASSNTRTSKKQQQPAWDWNFAGGQAFIKPRKAGAPAKPRPLFKPRPADDYDLWIFNPDPPRRRSINNTNTRKRSPARSPSRSRTRSPARRSK